jgi:uncharacterized membrane protein
VFTEHLHTEYAVCVRARVVLLVGWVQVTNRLRASTRLWHYKFPLIALAAEMMVVVVVGKETLLMLRRSLAGQYMRRRRGNYRNTLMFCYRMRAKQKQDVGYLLGHNFTPRACLCTALS